MSDARLRSALVGRTVRWPHLGIVASVALSGAFPLLLVVADGRLLVVVAVAMATFLADPRGTLGVSAALLLLPFLGLLRRVTSGADAYTAQDPLIILPVLLCLPAVIRILTPGRFDTPPVRWLLALCLWLGLSGMVALAAGWGATAIFGTAVAVVPVGVGLQIARGRLVGVPPVVLGSLPWVGAALVAYGFVQRIAPPRWDVAWLTSREIASIGLPSPGDFRVFGTSESPGVFALFVGLSLVVTIGRVLASSRLSPPVKLVVVASVSCLAVVVLSLAAVRGVLLSLPIVALLALALARRLTVGSVVVVSVATAVTFAAVPALLFQSAAARARFDIWQIGQDQSFVARWELLSAFAVGPAAGAALGSGPGTRGLGTTLTGDREFATIDNGYLSRLLETGYLGLLLFVVVTAVCLRAVAKRWQRRGVRHEEIVWVCIVALFLLVELTGPIISSTAGLFYWVALGVLAKDDGLKGEKGREVDR